MRTSSRGSDGLKLVFYSHWFRPVDQRPVPQLSKAVVTKCPDRPVVLYHEGVILDRQFDSAQTVDRDRLAVHSRLCCSISDLAIVTAAPPGNSPVGQKGQRMILPSPDAKHVGKIGHRHGNRLT